MAFLGMLARLRDQSLDQQHYGEVLPSCSQFKSCSQTYGHFGSWLRIDISFPQQQTCCGQGFLSLSPPVDETMCITGYQKQGCCWLLYVDAELRSVHNLDSSVCVVYNILSFCPLTKTGKTFTCICFFLSPIKLTSHILCSLVFFVLFGVVIDPMTLTCPFTYFDLPFNLI